VPHACIQARPIASGPTQSHEAQSLANMPDKTYVELDHIGVAKTFDNRYKTTLVKKMSDAIEDAIDSSPKLTTTKPPDKEPKGLSINGSLTISKSDKGVQAEIEWTLSYWPKTSIFGHAHSKTPWVEMRKPEKIDNDVEDAIDALVADFKNKIVKVLEKTDPQ
jgi:hypothetical protein